VSPATGSRWTTALLAVAAGGAVGGPARYGVDLLLGAEPGRVPWGTLVANVVGAGLLGALVSASRRDARMSRPPPAAGPAHLVLLLGTGFLGAFTTFSTFLLQVLSMVGQHNPFLALGYLLGSVAAGVAAGWVGLRLGTHLASRWSR